MYNRILNRPMFKLGGDIIDAQGSGITSGLDSPRKRYNAGTSLKDIDLRTNIEESKLRVTPEQYRSNAMDAIASGFLNPEARTMGEALYHTNAARKAGIEPLEASVAEQKFELSKIPLETRSAILATPESATRTRANILNQAILKRKQWESQNPNGDFRSSPGYTDYENQIIIATQGKTTTLGEARATALELMLTDETFAKIYRASIMLEEGEQKEKFKKQVEDALKRTVDYLMSVQAKAHGGRIGYQGGIGPNVMEEKVSEQIDTPQGDMSMTEDVMMSDPMAAGAGNIPGQDPYMLLRARLPQEVTDDVVRLIAYNPEAFKDFAAIESQEDVVLFNQKYGVELVLPTEQA